jgi:serine/threonine protein kinase
VAEYADCGALLDLISKSTIREDHMATICREVSVSRCFCYCSSIPFQKSGLTKADFTRTCYLHSYNIIYRDVQSDNILLFSSGDVKIGTVSLPHHIGPKLITFSGFWVLHKKQPNYEHDGCYTILDGSVGHQARGVRC